MNKKALKILLSNDDGVHAEGIHALAEALSDLADITIVAPDRNRSEHQTHLHLNNLCVSKSYRQVYILFREHLPIVCTLH